MAATLALLTALAGAGWWWSGSEGSLASGLKLVQALLPAGMALHTTEVQGSLRHGGQVGHAQWQQDGLALDFQGVSWQLDPALLLQGQLPVQRLQIQQLEGRTPPRQQAAPALSGLEWPLKLDLAWQIDRLRWEATAPIEALALHGHYRFDGQQHELELDHLQWAQGQYRGEMRLQARAPMVLQARLQGELPLQGAHTAGSPPALLQAAVDLQGPLAGAQPRLTLHARLSSPNPAPNAPALQLQGEIDPHAEQPLSTLEAQLQHLDLAPLWPGAPQTRLDGRVLAHPGPTGWQLDVDLRNGLTGPWDRQRLPLQHLQARVLQQPAGWQVQSLQARWPGGSLMGQGLWQAPQWQGRWQIQQLQPGQWLSWLEGPALSGELTASRAGNDRVDLAARLQAAGAQAAAPAALKAQGHWHAGQWTVEHLEWQATDAHVQAQGEWAPAGQQLQARMQWQLPGLNGQLQGQLSPRQGQGQWQLDTQDLPRLKAWLQRWPTLRQAWPDGSLPAALQASGQWQGGWADDGLQLQARLKTPGVALHTQATLALKASGPWQGRFTGLQLEGTPAPTTSAGLSLQSPLAWQWWPQTGRLQWEAHRWSLASAGHTASLQVGPGTWQNSRQAGQMPQARVQAAMTDLPLQWAQWLGWSLPPGDVMLQGDLDLRLDEHPSLLARLERSRGDLQVNTDLPQATRVQAGLRAGRARLQVEGAQVRLDLGWDSAQAGQLEARLQSQLDPASQAGLSGLWPAAAPLSGQVRARLPRVGAWAWLAPPGWRVQGSLLAQVDISGTRAQPQWAGVLEANDLAVRSAVEGIEFRQGHLRARLQEQQIRLEEFRLLGAGPQGGEVSAQGLVRWLPEASHAWQAVQMDLQMQARGLRVTSRADRRLSVSGQVRAQLERGQMQLRGQLQADSAQFILPDDSTPSLGKDVLVLRAQTQPLKTQVPVGVSIMGTPDVQVQLHLGPDFQLQGQGLSTRLTGQVQLSSSAATGGQPRLTGQVQTEGGRYKAYGQQLEIDQGLLVFSGPYDNPALDILALRPNLGQRVGVRVSGSAQTPRIRLYADPDMPDADKLAWLVLGRSPAAGGAESAVLQQAALALLGNNGKSLGGELASALGFDEVSLASRTTTTATGSTATGTAVTLGKRLSKDFYLAYESSVSGAFGSLFIFYDLSRKLALRAQTGETNALDLIWSIRHD